MSEHMRRAVDKLKYRLLELCGRVEHQLEKAVRAVLEREASLAQQVIDGDALIDQMEVDVEEQCLQILALHQPVAIDLRFIVTALKINNDLERIGDLTVNIAERAVDLAGQESDSPGREPVPVMFDFEPMVQRAQGMVRESLDALIEMDCTRAHRVLLADDEVDAMNRQMFILAQTRLAEAPHMAPTIVDLLSVSRQIERIADHATNIAEDVIYMVQGRIVRHRSDTP